MLRVRSRLNRYRKRLATPNTRWLELAHGTGVIVQTKGHRQRRGAIPGLACGLFLLGGGKTGLQVVGETGGQGCRWWGRQGVRISGGEGDRRTGGRVVREKERQRG